jgi:ribonucleoside-diphosphate reductase alpha chain
MVDIAGRTNSTTEIIADLRRKLAETTDPMVRRALEQAIATLQASTPAGASARVYRALVAGRVPLAAPEPPAGREPEPDFSENALTVLKHRYLRRNEQGVPIENPTEMLWRVARAVAEGDRLYNEASNVEASASEFYRMMAKLEFLPNSPTMMNAGTGAGTLSACFVLPLKDTMLEEDGITDAITSMVAVQKYGGGTGFALSDLRAKGASISTTHGKACGPIAVLRMLSSASTMVTQGGKRDGANMAVMSVHHPDVVDFITAKEQEGQIHNFNISVGVDEEFMQAVEADGQLELRDPRTNEVVDRIPARDVFNRIVAGAWRNGEPGMIFLDRVNQDNPTPHIGLMTATNPCGEQPLLPYESCNLGSINLARMLKRVQSPEGERLEADWEKLRATVWTAVHFLDNVIDVNRYSVPQIERMTKLTRKIGLGVMGFADMLARVGIAYDSDEGLAMGREVMRLIRQEADNASVELAKERGTFPAFKGSRHDRPGGLRLRNACRLTVAPTGTISMIAGCSSGIEPIFALAYRKQNILEGKTLYYTDAAFEAVAKAEGFWSEELVESLSQGNSLKDRGGVPQWAKAVFTTAPDIAPEWHVRMQAAFQESTDAAISKTINFPNQASQEDVRKAYLLAWQLGCKGITVYRAGSREKEVLTAGTSAKEKVSAAAAGEGSHLHPRSRPQVLRGLTERVRTGHGNMYVTVTFDEQGNPFEVFGSLGKAGGTDAANLEAVARLVSLALRAGIDPADIIEQIRGITSEPVWDSGVLVRSAPDAMAIALQRAIEEAHGGKLSTEAVAAQPALIDRDTLAPSTKEPLVVPPSPVKGKASPEATAHARNVGGRAGWETCPKCSGPLPFQEGCMTCRECGYSKCE